MIIDCDIKPRYQGEEVTCFKHGTRKLMDDNGEYHCMECLEVYK